MVQVDFDGHSVDLGHPRQRSVFAVLATVANQVVHVDSLVHQVWGDAQPTTARSALYSYVARIRRLLPPNEPVRILRRSGGYILEVDPDSVDLHRFRNLVARTRSASDDERAAIYDEAIALHRGTPFTGLRSSWLDQQRQVIEAELLAAMLDRNDVELRRGRHAELAVSLTAQLAAHPLDERLIAQAILAICRCGRQADAIDLYHRSRRLLADELGVDPGPELRQLYQQVVSNDPALAGGNGTAGGPRVDTRVHRPAGLPHDVAGFTGRATELAALRPLAAATDSSSTSIAVIDGPPGIGKTAFAIHFGHSVAGMFPDGQLYLDLRGYDAHQSPMSPVEGLGRALESLGMDTRRMPDDLDQRAAAYRSLLAGRRMLVILDNAFSSTQVRPLLPGSRTCFTVVTSRNRLGGLLARDGAHRIGLAELTITEAVELLATLLPAHWTRPDPNAVDPNAVESLARLCGCLPLALRVAGEHIAMHAAAEPAELLAALADERERLRLLAVDEDEETAVRPVFSWSYRSLKPEAAATFRMLGLHAGAEIDPATAAVLVDADQRQVRDWLDELAGRSLIERTHSPDTARYRTHDLLRLYAAELAGAEMTEDDQRTAVRRVITWYLGAAAAAVRLIAPARREVPLPASDRSPPSFPDRQQAMAWCERNRANLVAATEQALRTGELELAWKLPAALWGFYQVRAHRADHAETHRLALIAAQRLGDPFAEGWVHTNLGMLDQDLLRYPSAIEHLNRALDLRSAIDDEIGQAQTLSALGNAYWQSARLDEARRCYERSLRIVRDIGDRQGEATGRCNLGGIDHLQGRYERAIENYQGALAISREIGNRWGEGYPLTNIGESLHELGRYAEAIEHFRAALAIRRETGDRFGEAFTLRALAETLQVTGQRAVAQQSVRSALALLEELDDPTVEDARVQLRRLTGETPA